MFIKLSIDDLPPKNFLSDLESWKKLKRESKGFHQPRWKRNEYYMPVGINISKMLDWRKLERRSHELRKKSNAFNAEFWRLITWIHKECNPSKAHEIWIHDSDNEVFVYHGERDGMRASLTTRSITDLVDDCVPNPNRRAIIIKDEQARNLMRLHHRSNDFMKRQSVYYQAFQEAIDNRLRSFINDNLRSKDQYCVPTIFMIKNEDREYTVQLTYEGAMQWGDSRTNVYECT